MLTWLGFKSLSEFFASLLQPKLFAKIWCLLFAMTPLFLWIEKAIGLSAPMFISFMILNIIEFYTGIRASVAEGRPVTSVKMHRFLVKTVAYVMTLGVFWQYSKHAGGDIGDKTAIVFYSMTYWLVFNYISLILVRSIFENLHRMGVKEASKIYFILDNKLTRFIAILVAPPDKEKTER